MTGSIEAAFATARRDPERVVLEGLHPLKHAIRFGAAIELVATPDMPSLLALANALAPDVVLRLADLAVSVGSHTFAHLAPVPPPTGVLAIARRPPADLAAVLAAAHAPALLLVAPRHAGNVGAAVRVAAAAGASAVLTLNGTDPWAPAALRGSAGLHFALPVIGIEALPDSARALVACDPDGPSLGEVGIPPLEDGSLLLFGSERHGLGEEWRARAHRVVAIPMRTGVSSLNLATAVAIVLYAWRLQRQPCSRLA